jgi:hypothetical protein
MVLSIYHRDISRLCIIKKLQVIILFITNLLPSPVMNLKWIEFVYWLLLIWHSNSLVFSILNASHSMQIYVISSELA